MKIRWEPRYVMPRDTNIYIIEDDHITGYLYIGNRERLSEIGEYVYPPTQSEFDSGEFSYLNEPNDILKEML